MTQAGQACRLCHGLIGTPSQQAQEHMLGSLLLFDYLHCEHCGCLQIAQIPEDLSPFYPPEYYSFQGYSKHPLKRHFRGLRDRWLLQKHPLGPWLNQLRPNEALLSLQVLNLDRSQKILDVGCGQGQLVQSLRAQGFSQAWGCDPFVQDPPEYVRAHPLSAEANGWDLIMFHHSLEHLPQPRASLREAVERLQPGGFLLIRVPTVDSWAYTHFGAHWVQWDPPRHLYVFSRQNLHHFAKELQLEITAFWDDSSDFQFWGSQAYQQGQKLPAPPSYLKRRPLRQQAALLNAKDQGDQVVVLYQKPTPSVMTKTQQTLSASSDS